MDVKEACSVIEEALLLGSEFQQKEQRQELRCYLVRWELLLKNIEEDVGGS